MAPLDKGPRPWGRGTESQLARQEEIAGIVAPAVANLNSQRLSVPKQLV